MKVSDTFGETSAEMFGEVTHTLLVGHFGSTDSLS